jgi:multidrug efflux pump subunit AcrA (membrane-fusion protein)
MDADALTVEEFVDYCEVQAGLLAGHVETMRAEADALLDEVDDELAATRDRLAERSETDGPDGTETPPSTNGPANEREAADALDALEETQALVKAKQARMRAFQSLARGYTDLAATLEREVDDGETALERVVAFEAEHDAPLYFEDRETLYETVSDGSSA